MKQILLTFIVLFSTKIYSQNYSENFLGDEYELYKGVKAKLKDDLIAVDFSHNFYGDLDELQKKYDGKVLYPSSKYNFVTEKDSLKNRTFLIENIIGKDGNPFDKSKADYFDKPIFVLKDENNQQLIYYKYDNQFEHNFPFQTSPINYSEDILCSKLSKTVDDFTNETKYDTPIMEGHNLAPASIMRVSKKGKPDVYYLSLRTSGNTVNVNKTGVILIFDDDTKWNKNSEIDVEAGKYGYDYSAFITLTQNDLKLFSTKRIKKFRLYIYDENVGSGFADKFKIYTKCIMK